MQLNKETNTEINVGNDNKQCYYNYNVISLLVCIKFQNNWRLWLSTYETVLFWLLQFRSSPA